MLSYSTVCNAFCTYEFRIFKNNVPITTLPVDARAFLDLDVICGQEYTYGVRVVYVNPNGMSASVQITHTFVSDTEDEVGLTFITQLGDNYPNPFNPETKINFSLREESNVRIEIFNVRGQIVKTLIDTELPAGNHNVIWNGFDDNNRVAASGVYFYKMTTDSYQSVRRMVLLK